MTNHPKRDVVRSHDQFKFLGPNHISGKAEARVIKFGIQVGYVSC